MTPTQLEQAVLDNLGTISTTTNSAGQFHRLTLPDGEGVLIYGNRATLTLEVELSTTTTEKVQQEALKRQIQAKEKELEILKSKLK